MRRVLLVTFVLVLAVAGPATAATCPRTTVAQIEPKVMCPVCGTSLAVARDAPLARRERAFIARLVGRCRSERQIEDALVAQFGPSVLALPPDHGVSAAAYVVPGAGGIAALALAALLLVAWRRRRTPAAAPPPRRLSRADELRLEAELDRLR
jgi:cytochrome c-type biogenesis protein CcmH